MSLDAPLIAFWAVAALAAWVQTLTGFALGLIVMGATGLMGLMPLPQAAAVTSLLVVLNGVQVLARGHRDLDRRIWGWLMIGAVPGLVAGYLAMLWLAGQAVEVLRLVLGLVIAGAALQLARHPHPRLIPSPPASFVAAGMAGGIMGGLFATSGPPVIWQLYRQPLPLAKVRATLLGLFFATQIIRLTMVGGSGALTATVLLSAIGAAPAVILGTWLARRFPPPVAPLTIRRAALALLAASGVAMIVTSLARI